MSATYFSPVISQDSITVTQIVPTKYKRHNYIAEVYTSYNYICPLLGLFQLCQHNL